ncbi:MAG: pseudouridine synthase [Burkholderiaceae bacterium]
MPPDRDGVGPSCVALPPGSWPTVLDFLASRFPHVTRMQWLARMRRGDVLDADGAPLAPDSRYRPHAKIHYYRDLPAEAKIPFEAAVLFQDDYLVVADKPHFLPVTPSGRYLQETLLVRLKRRLGIATLAPMHRLDRETAGLVLFSIRPETRDRYQALFRDRAVKKRYEAIAPWRADLQFPRVHRSRLRQSAAFMRMEEVAGAPNAETTIELLEIRGELARYALLPTTGQKHQLRVHLNELGIPILHDRIYPAHAPQPDEGAEDYRQPLQLLARTLEFLDPVSGQRRRFESRLRLDFPDADAHDRHCFHENRYRQHTP